MGLANKDYCKKLHPKKEALLPWAGPKSDADASCKRSNICGGAVCLMWNFDVFVKSSISSRKGCRISPCCLHFKGKTAGTSPPNKHQPHQPQPPPSQKLPFHCCRFQFSLHFEPRSEHGGLCQTGVLVASAKDGEGRPVGRVEMSNCERGTKNHNLYQSFHTFVKGAFTFHQKNCERVTYL